MLRSAFEESGEVEDYSRYGWASQLETLLGNALVERQLFDCKQGFYTLGPTRDFDEASFNKICRTLSAMASYGPGAVGHVVVGIADDQADAARIQALDGVRAQKYKHFYVTGIDREAGLDGRTLNDYWTWLTQKISSGPVAPPAARSVVADARLVQYRSRSVIVLRITGGSSPAFFEGKIFERRGSETVEVPHNDYMRVFERFATGRTSSS